MAVLILIDKIFRIKSIFLQSCFRLTTHKMDVTENNRSFTQEEIDCENGIILPKDK